MLADAYCNGMMRGLPYHEMGIPASCKSQVRRLLVMRHFLAPQRAIAAGAALTLGLGVLGIFTSQPARADSVVVCHVVSDNTDIDLVAVTTTGHGECIGGRYASDWEETEVCIEIFIRVSRNNGYWSVFECNTVRAGNQNVLGTGAAMAPFSGFNCYRSRTRFWGTFQGVYEQGEAHGNEHCFDTQDLSA